MLVLEENDCFKTGKISLDLQEKVGSFLKITLDLKIDFLYKNLF